MFCIISIFLFMKIYQVEYCAFHTLRLFICFFSPGNIHFKLRRSTSGYSWKWYGYLIVLLFPFSTCASCLLVWAVPILVFLYFLSLFRPRLAWIACLVMRGLSKLWLLFMLIYLHNIVGSGTISKKLSGLGSINMSKYCCSFGRVIMF